MGRAVRPFLTLYFAILDQKVINDRSYVCKKGITSCTVAGVIMLEIEMVSESMAAKA